MVDHGPLASPTTTNNNTDATAIDAAAILCGGGSRRMGRTKALIEVDGVPMARRVADALRAAGCADVVLVGGDADELGSLGVPIVADLFPGEGPVGGVVTAMRHFQGRDVVVVPCDVPYLDPATVEQLCSASDASDDEVIVARTDRIEPMCALWRAEALSATETAFGHGTRALHAVLDILSTRAVDVSASALRNVNVPGDLPA